MAEALGLWKVKNDPMVGMGAVLGSSDCEACRQLGRVAISDLVIVTYDPTLGRGRGLWSYNSEV